MSPPTHAHESSAKLHQITFCESCDEAIPAKAMTCFHCNAKQSHAEPALKISFCESCGEDYPARAHACFHCGHLNPLSPYLEGRVRKQ